MSDNDKYKEIYEKYEKKISELEEKIEYEKQKSVTLHKKKYLRNLFICIGIIITIVTIPFVILFIDFGKNYLGWFENYEGMHKVELPIEEPAKGGTLYLPNDWVFKEENGWYLIYDTSNNVPIAIEAYHGYEKFISGPSNYEWINYEVNPEAQKYDYENLKFEYITNTENNCVVIKANDLFGIDFMYTCSYPGRRYSRKYIIVSTIEYDILKKIDNSYSWGGEIHI